MYMAVFFSLFFFVCVCVCVCFVSLKVYQMTFYCCDNLSLPACGVILYYICWLTIRINYSLADYGFVQAVTTDFVSVFVTTVKRYLLFAPN